MGKPDVVYECHESLDVSYRVAPNPDAIPGVGFKHGAELLFSNDGGENWNTKACLFIAPESMEAIGIALIEASKDLKG